GQECRGSGVPGRGRSGRFPAVVIPRYGPAMQSSLADSMVGLPLSVARAAERLAYVPAEHTAKPWNALDLPGMWYWIKRRGERPSIIDSLAFGGGALYCFGAGGIEAVSIFVDSALAGMPII